MPTDAELLRRYVNGRSEEAFAELVRRHLKLVYFSALRQVGGSAHAAQDVTQEVFTALARKARSLSEREVLASWLYTSTRFAAAKFRRAEVRRQKHEMEAETMRSLNDDAESAGEWERLRPFVDDVLHELSERDRAVVLLRFFDGRSFVQIGAACGLSEDAARMRVERAIEKLRALLARRGVTSSAAALAGAFAHQAAAAAPTGLAGTIAGSAFASASASVAPAVVWFEFMSTSKFAASAAILLVALTCAVSVREIKASHEAEAALIAAERENDGLRQRVARVVQRGSTPPARAGDALRVGEGTASAPPRSAGDADGFMARHPEVQQLFMAQQRAEVAGRYWPLLKALHLSAEQIEQFKDLAVQGRAGRFGGPNGLVLNYSTGGDRAAAAESLHALLGEDGYRMYENFAPMQAAWQITTELAGELYATSTPISAAQGQEIFQLVSAHIVAEENSARPEIRWETLMPEAQRLLTSEQLAVLNYFRQRDEIERATARLMQENRSKIR